MAPAASSSVPNPLTQGLQLLKPWTTRAVNLPEHADNAIHTDAGARAAGFSGALVAGTTIYAYMCHVPAAAWGETWLTSGGSEVWLRKPVMDDEPVDCVPDGDRVGAQVGGEERAAIVLITEREAPTSEPVGEALPTIDVVLDEAKGAYGRRAGDDLPLYGDLGVAHPAVWPALANDVTAANLINGSWIHVRSRIRHLGTAPMGATVRVTSVVVDRFDSRAGERAIVDLRFHIGTELVAWVEHESIIALH